MRDSAAVSAADLKLIVLALLAIATLVLLVTRFRVNAFLSLLLASLVVGASAVGMGRARCTTAAGERCPTPCRAS